MPPVPDAIAEEFPAAADDPLTAPMWATGEVPTFAPAAVSPVAATPLVASEPWPTDVPAALAPVDAAPAAAAPTDSLFAPAAPVALPQPMAATLVDRSSPDVIHTRPVHETTTKIAGLDLTALLATVVTLGASDLHLTAGARPMPVNI